MQSDHAITFARWQQHAMEGGAGFAVPITILLFDSVKIELVHCVMSKGLDCV